MRFRWRRNKRARNDRPRAGVSQPRVKHDVQGIAMPRAYWKGYLRLSLVTCPVEPFPATTPAEKTHFHQIDTRTGHRLRQQMVDEETGRVVDAEHKGRGYEFKRQYVPIDEKELEAIEIAPARSTSRASQAYPGAP